MIADQQTGVLAGRALAREAARLYVTGEDWRIAPSAAKLFCTEMAGKTADLAVQVHGGPGYMREMAVERIYRDVRRPDPGRPQPIRRSNSKPPPSHGWSMAKMRKRRRSPVARVVSTTTTRRWRIRNFGAVRSSRAVTAAAAVANNVIALPVIRVPRKPDSHNVSQTRGIQA